MTHLNFILAAWGIVTVVLVLYVLWLVRLGKKLTGEAAPSDRRWSSS